MRNHWLLALLLSTSLGCAEQAPAPAPAPPPSAASVPPATVVATPAPQNIVPVEVSKEEQASVDAAWADMQIAQLKLQLALQLVLKNHRDLSYDGNLRKFYRTQPAKK